MDTSPSFASRLRFWVPILALAAGLFLALQPLLATGFAAVPGGPRDARLVHFSLEHAHRFLLRQEPHLDLWDPPLFYPARNAGAYTDVLLSLAPLYSPWRLLGVPPDTAFQLWLIVVWTINFGAFQLFLTRCLRLDPVAAAAGAYLFAFGSSRVANATHPQLIPGFYLVLALGALFRVMELDGAGGVERTRRRRWIGVFFLALVLQLYGAFYPFYFFCLFCTLAAALAFCWPESRGRLLRLARGETAVLAGAGLAAAALVAPLVERYLLAARFLGLRPWEAIEPRLPRWQSWLLMGQDNWLHGWLYGTAFWPKREGWLSSAHTNGLGVVATACAVAGLWSYRRRISTRLLAGLSLLMVLLTTLWPGGWTLWRFFFEALPGAGGIRVVGRAGMLLLIPAGIGVAYFFERRSKGRWPALAAGLALLIALEQAADIPHYDKRQFQRRVEAIGGGVEPDCRAFFASATDSHSGWAIHEDAMWAALETGVPTINGRYGNKPPGWELRQARSSPEDPAGRAQLDEALEAWLTYHCIDPAEVCRIETDGEQARSVDRSPISRGTRLCSAP